MKRLFEQINKDGGKTISAAEAESVDVQAAGWSLGASQAGNFTYYLSRAGKGVADYKLTAQVPVKALVTWDPAVRLKTSTGFVPAAKTLKTIQSNVLKFRNYYQQRAGSTYYRILNDDGDFIGYSGRQRSPLDPFITGNQVPTNMPADRVDQSRVDTEFALKVEERDRISATDPDRATDPDPLRAPGQPRYRLYGNLSKREGVNHGSLTWFAWLRSKNDLA